MSRRPNCAYERALRRVGAIEFMSTKNKTRVQMCDPRGTGDARGPIVVRVGRPSKNPKHRGRLQWGPWEPLQRLDVGTTTADPRAEVHDNYGVYPDGNSYAMWFNNDTEECVLHNVSPVPRNTNSLRDRVQMMQKAGYVMSSGAAEFNRVLETAV